MWRFVFTLGSLLLPIAIAAPSFAGMSQDLADCPDPNRPSSAAACSRIMASGRLPRDKFYIAFFNRGWAYRQAGDNARALADFDTVVKLNPRYANGYYSRALVQRNLGASDKAITDLEKALRIDSGFTAAHALMGRIQEDRGDNAAARGYYQRALASEPKLIDAQSAQAKARERLAALPDDHGSASAHVLASGEQTARPAETSSTKRVECRRFVPSASTTISVDCTE